MIVTNQCSAGFGSALEEPLTRLLGYCRENDWSGWDPFDGLSSPLFRIPLLQNRFCRLAFIQLCKRNPINLRPLFRVPKSANPKGLALFASTLIRLSQLGLAPSDEAKLLLNRLIEARSHGWKVAC